MPKPVILFLAANPDGTTPVALGDECAAIERELKMTGHDDFDLRSKWAITVDDVMRALNELKPAIVHFSGHGNAGGILLHRDDGAAHAVAGDVLAEMIASTGAPVRVVLLNACFTDDQAEPLSDAIGCAVGMVGKISDDAARAFSVAFYRTLGHRGSVYQAFRQAQATLGGHGLARQAAPRCLTRADVDASALVLGGGIPAAADASRDGRDAPVKPETSGENGGIQVSNTTGSGGRIFAPVIGGVHGGNVNISSDAPGPKGGS